MATWTRSDYLQTIGIAVSALVAVGVFLLEKRLTAKQRVDHRLEVQEKTKIKLYEIHYNNHSSKIQLYNSKLLNKKYFAENKRDVWWGYPYHAAELYAANFDGLEFVVSIEEWGGQKYYKVGVIPYERILGVRPEGDGSFNGTIFYVKPRLLQLDKYAVGYKSYRYYPTNDALGRAEKPLRIKLVGALKSAVRRLQ
jgi:hypothetical protein